MNESNEQNQPRRSPWCGAIEEIQRRVLSGRATDSTGDVLDWLRGVRDLTVVELCACVDDGVSAQVKLVYLERVRPSRPDLARPLLDVVGDLFLHARDYFLAFSPDLDLDMRFLIVATGASSISMTRIAPMRIEPLRVEG